MRRLTVALALVVGTITGAHAGEVPARAGIIECPSDTTITFAGRFAEQRGPSGQRPISAELAVNNEVVAQSVDGRYRFRFLTSDRPQNICRVWALFPNGERAILEKGAISVVEESKLRLHFSEVTVKDVDTLLLAPAGGFSPPEVNVYIQSLGRLYGPYIAAKSDGTYRVKISDFENGQLVVYANTVVHDVQYVSAEYPVNKIGAIEVSIPTAKLDLDEERTLDLVINLGCAQTATCSIRADNREIGKVDVVAGANRVQIDASRAAVGSHQFVASVVIDGDVYTSERATIDLRSAFRSESDAKYAVYWNKVEETQSLREKLSQRRKILGGAADVLGDRIGKPVGLRGVIRGLSVASLGPFEFGQTMPVRITVQRSRKGTLSIEWGNSYVDLNTEISLLNAILFAQRYIAARKHSFSATDYEYSVTFGSGDGIRGDSAGAALACLLVSEFLNLPIRSDIAVTGTVKSDGAVGEVGGYSEKSFAAFSDPYVTTLIIPHTRQAIWESTQIGAFVATHRIIAAQNMTQVLRHALVTSEFTSWLCEKQWLDALAAYRAGETWAAIQRLKSIRSKIPEDLTCQLWLNWLLDDNQLQNDIDFNEKWAKDFRNRNPEVLQHRNTASQAFKVLGAIPSNSD